MSLGPGSTLGPFKIQSLIGKGGMGEVFSALDTRVDRKVAVKVLPTEFSRDADRLRRFQLEARTLATLNHPNVALLFGFEEHAAQNLLVLELVEGETLADRLRRGALPLEEALQIAIQIAAGLEAAHAKGIIHRDLKPANIKLTHDDRAKVLDFGLAKLVAPDPTSTATILSDSPTILTGSTLPGLILGTAAYMSPEQAKGKTLDKRTDIWSFGCVLYECLTGKRLFDGESVSDCIGAVLHKEPDWSALSARAPVAVQSLLQRCLAKDRNNRLHDIADARIELQAILSGAAEPTPFLPPSNSRRSLATGLTLGLGILLGLLATMLYPRKVTTAPPVPPRQSLIRIPGSLKGSRQSFSISPDGLRLAYLQEDHLYIRKLTEPESSARAIEQSETAIALFWSPDSQWVGFMGGKQIYRVRADQIVPQAVCESPVPFVSACGAVWLANNTIVFTAGVGTNGLLQSPASGGIPKTFLAHNPQTDLDFHDPSPLPDGKSLAFIIHRGTNGGIGPIDTIAATSGGTRKTLYTHPGRGALQNVLYSPSGHLLFEVRANTSTLWALPFSLTKLEATGEPFLVYSQADSPSVAEDGTFVFLSRSTRARSRLARVSRANKTLATFGQPALHAAFPPRWSPDAKRIVTSLRVTESDRFSLWVNEQTNSYQLTFSKDDQAIYPAFSPDGANIAYTDLPLDIPDFRLILLPLNGSEPVALGIGFAPAFTSRGDAVVFLRYEKSMAVPPFDLCSIPLPVRPDATNHITVHGRFTVARVDMFALSPDDQLIAYVSRETETHDLYIAPFPSLDRRLLVNSPKEAYWPVWRKIRDQLFLYFIDHSGTIYEVPVSGDHAALSVGLPQPVLKVATEGLGNVNQNWPPGFDVSSDGQEFLVLERPEGVPQETFVTIVENLGAVLAGKK